MELSQDVEQRPLAAHQSEPAEPVRPRGRPWVKGQSGNPAGRAGRGKPRMLPKR